MAEVIRPKRGPLFAQQEKAVEVKKSFFKSKKFIAIIAVVFIAIVLILVILLTGTEYNEEVLSKTALLLPLVFKKN